MNIMNYWLVYPADTKFSHVKRKLCVCWVHKGISLKVKNTILSRIRFFRGKDLRPFWTKICRMRFFFENRAPSHFGIYHFASLCQKSVITNEPISRKIHNRRTNGRTNEHRLIYRTSSGRSNNQQITSIPSNKDNKDTLNKKYGW